MVIRNCTVIWIGLAVLLVFEGLSSARAQFGGGPAGEQFEGFRRVGNTLDGPDWVTIHAAVSARLEKTDLSQLLRPLAKAKPTTNIAELVERLDIFVRAGDRGPADRVIQALAQTALVQNAYEAGNIVDFLIAHGEWDLARHLMDVCPLAMPSTPELFVAHFEGSPSFPDLDHWLAYREHLNPAFWSSIYLEYRRATGTLRSLFDARAADVRAHPQDMARIEALLAVTSRLIRPPKLDWLPTVCHFPLAIENLAMGMKLSEWPAVGIPFLERALQLPITFDDIVWLEVQSGATNADFRNEPTPDVICFQIKFVLTDRYKAVGQADKAQALAKEIAGQTPSGLFWNFSRSPGRYQVGFGGQAIEQRLPVAEVEDKSDYHYWLKRADDCLGRNERTQADQAFQKALELTRATPGINDWDRIAVMNAYVDFLDDPARPMPTVTWLRSELAKAPLAGAYLRGLLNRMIRLFPITLSDLQPTNEILWRYLAAHKTWEEQETSVLQVMIAIMPATDRDSIWSRAEKLAGSDPSRETSLGRLMASMNEIARSKPLLQDAARQTQSQADRHAAAVSGLNAALTVNDWPHAWAFWPEVRTGLNRDEFDRWSKDLLDASVKSGADDAAIELFAAWTHDDSNLYHEGLNSRANIGLVSRLANLGLRDRLVQFYRAMAAADPASHVPHDILPTLLNPAPVTPQRGGPKFPGNPNNSKPQPEIPFDLHASDPISLNLTNVDLTSALQRVCDQAKISYVFALQGCKTQKVTLVFKAVPLNQAAQSILDASAPSLPLRFVMQRGIFMMCPAPGPHGRPAPDTELRTAMLNARVTACFREQDLSVALNSLLGVLGVNYSINVGDFRRIAPKPLSIAVTDASAQDVLERLLKTSRYPLNHWIERNILWIGPRDEAPE